MIKTFKHKGLAELFNHGSPRKVQPKHGARLRVILTALNAATNVGQLNASSLRLGPLKGRSAGRYAIWVDDSARVMFRFDGEHAIEVDYGDAH